METLDPQIIVAIITTSGAIINALIALISRLLRKRKGSTTATQVEGGNGKKEDKKTINIQKLPMVLSVVLFLFSIILIAKILVTPPAAASSELLFNGWHTWPGDAIEASVSGNTVTLNGRASMAGFATTGLNAKAMRNKTVTLEIRNAGSSVWDDGRMIKITVNDNNLTVHPDNITNLIEKEYVPVTSLVVLTLPRSFDGKLGFVFYNADLRDLHITATYR